jgi:uncharacterized protein
MVIRISDIPPEGLTLEFDDKLDLFDQGAATTAFHAKLGVKPMAGGTLHVTGKIQAAPALECSRCLENFIFSVDTELDVELVPVKALGGGAEHELGGGELDTEFYEGEELKPVDLVKEQVLISLPMVPLHSPECKGLCAVCGADLNKTECGHRRNAPGDFGAFSALKDLLKK